MYKIAVMPGDGIGSEVIAEAIKVLNATELEYEQIKCDIGGTAYLKNGNPLPKESVQACEDADAILFGAVGHDTVSYDIPRKVLIYLRVEKNAYANIRPFKTYLQKKKADDTPIDITIIRDNAEGFSLQHPGMLGKTLGTDRRIITENGATKIIEYAIKYAIQHNRNKITCIDQSNWLYSDKLFRETFEKIVENYPALENDVMHVDVAAMNISAHPEKFDVIVTPDLYGDILSGIIISKIGGIGIPPSACIGDDFAYFEPIHGPAWDIAGDGTANPTASILSAKLMLEYLQETEKAQQIEEAVTNVLKQGTTRTFDLGGTSTTSEMGDAIAQEVRRALK